VLKLPAIANPETLRVRLKNGQANIKTIMTVREAKVSDIKQIQIVRNSVRENTLSNPNLVTDRDCEEFITVRGKGWVCEIDNKIVGFAIADLKENNIWALFIDPLFEKRGIGQKLHNTMLDWYFNQTNKTVWLGTAFDTRAEQFYRKAGWKEVGMHGTKEIKFEMTFNDWIKAQTPR
jgi:GNAT superfamily N-acetyltransferase